MRRVVSLIGVLSSIVFLVGVASLVFFVVAPIERPAVTILAPRNAAEALPVYAQFVVTQTLVLPRPIEATKLVIPILIPDSTRTMIIDVRQEGRLVERWRRPTIVAEAGTGASLLQLPFSEPRALTGHIEVSISDTALPDALKETAPRLFVEMADTLYPNGNYRIAQNEKQGDVGLLLFERIPRGEQFVEVWPKRGAYFLAEAGIWLLVAVLIAILPGVVVRTAHQGPTSSQEE